MWTLLVTFWIGLAIGLAYVGAAVLKVSALNLAILIVLFAASYMWGAGTMHSLQPTAIAVLGVFAGFLALYLTSPLHNPPAIWPWFVFFFLAFMMFSVFAQLPAAPVTKILHWVQLVAMPLYAALPIALGAWWLQATTYRGLAAAYGTTAFLSILAGALVAWVELRKRRSG